MKEILNDICWKTPLKKKKPQKKKTTSDQKMEPKAKRNILTWSVFLCVVMEFVRWVEENNRGRLEESPLLDFQEAKIICGLAILFY